MSCHQSGGPLFAASWPDTLRLEQFNKPDYEFADEILQVQKKHGPGIFHNSVIRGNNRLYAADLMEKACRAGPPAEYRKCISLLSTTARKQAMGDIAYQTREGATYQKIEAIVDRLSGLDFRYHPAIVRQLDSEFEHHPDVALDFLPSYLDPLSPRAQVHLVPERAGRKMRQRPMDSGVFELESTSGKVLEYTEDFLSPFEFIEILSSQYSKAEAEDFAKGVKEEISWLNRPNPALHSGEVIFQKFMDSPEYARSVARGGPVAQFRKYCTECHVGNADPHLNFMENLNDDAILAEFRANPRIRARLDWANLPDEKRMPPPTSTKGIELRNQLADFKAMNHAVGKNYCGEILAPFSIPAEFRPLNFGL